MRASGLARIGRIGRAKFVPASFTSGHPASDAVHRNGGNPLFDSTHALRAHCVALQTLRAEDPHAPGARSALFAAYTLLVPDSWAPAPLAALQEGLGALPEALRPLHTTTTTSGMEGAKGMGGKNRKQLAWAGAREFAMRFMRERFSEGRYEEDEEAEEDDPVWCVGWPRDTATPWVLWFFKRWDTLRAELARRTLMALLLSFVVAPFRLRTVCTHTTSVRRATVYASRPPTRLDALRGSALPLHPLPPAPLLRAAPPEVASAAFGEGREAITVPTLHGAGGDTAAMLQIQLRTGICSRPPRAMGGKRRNETGKMSRSLIIRRQVALDFDARAHHPRDDTATQTRSPRPARAPRASLHSDKAAPALTLFRDHDDPALRAPNTDIPTPGLHDDDHALLPLPPGIDDPPLIQVLLDLHVPHEDPTSDSRAPFSPAPAHACCSSRACRSAGAWASRRTWRGTARGGRWAASSGTSPQPIELTQEDILEKDARPIVWFERQLPGVSLPPGVAAVGVGGADEEEEDADPYAPAASMSAGAAASPAASTPIDPAATAAYAAARADVEAERAVPFDEVDEDAGPGLDGDGDEDGGSEAGRHLARAALSGVWGSFLDLDFELGSSSWRPAEYDCRRCFDISSTIRHSAF
ncbi:hypothetical protein B0H17DRAFT_1135559 [Mycena rosella]|uniref:Uncharacterized protein n=1 Tax=Mycena rosella TaxID=1033263 RepID=A0AAD7DCQ9_MYCRO|nr:hypothetical protein B0H17DRAFT_1135559 [Mycena rosella]